MANRKLTADITNAFGPSGYEEDVVKVIQQYTENFNVKVDAMHNVYARLQNPAAGKPVVMLDAHSDELGFMVQSISGNGMIHFLNIGGWVTTNIPAHQVVIKNSRGEYIKGVTSSKPPHFMSAAERTRMLEQTDITIDIGATSRDEVIHVFGIQPGDPVMPDVTCDFNERNGVFMSKAFDNRIGCQCIIETMENVKELPLQVEPVGAFAAQEEVGCRGAKVTAQVVKPDFAIVFEGSPSDDFFTDSYTAQCRMKHGVQIRVIDGGMISHAGFLRYAKKIAEQHDIPYQIGVRRSGSTNGSAIHTTHHAVPCLVLGIPTRYAHTHYCYLAESDLDATIQLATEILKSLNEETIKEIIG
ncbi:putative aminopeptidase YsdC [bioreactor metagenome]|uniref:Putative aminopeptidase YsdC n=1 Tax=bioreactor metagenome TaxID=1076179 RepID=A0A645CW74_9ZZZZ